MKGIDPYIEILLHLDGDRKLAENFQDPVALIPGEGSWSFQRDNTLLVVHFCMCFRGFYPRSLNDEDVNSVSR